MAFTEKALGQAQIASGTVTILYTVPLATTAIVKDLQLCNVATGTYAPISLWIDTDGTQATDAEAVIRKWSLPPNDFLHWSGFMVMSAGATIKASCGIAGAVTITANGAEIT